MQEIPECQCPLGLIPHFYHNSDGFSFGVLKCQCPHGLIPHFYLTGNDISVKQLSIVSMPSRASTSFLQRVSRVNRVTWSRCQCPHGLVPHFYKNSFRDAMLGMDMCQCPLGLVPHFYGPSEYHQYCEAASCQCPLGLVPHFYLTSRAGIMSCVQLVSMPSRASTSFLQYPFKNLGFMRFPEPVFSGIYQNILTIAVFRAC